VAILVTGVAGFIGYHVARALLDRGDHVVGVDNVNAYYDVRLKHARLAHLQGRSGFVFHKVDLADRDAVADALEQHPDIQAIVHLAAQAGVRYSMQDPWSYVASNLTGHLVMLEIARNMPRCRHLVYASSSSVYGGNTALPFRETDRVDTPLSLYAATKRADELMSHAYAHLYAIPQTGLRFFTVYGPWGRPDMAYFSFAKAILEGAPITVYDEGRLRRDFTYIDDIVAGIIGCLDRPPEDPRQPRILNIGNSGSEAVSDLIDLLETSLGRRAIRVSAPRPLADVEETFAAVDAIGALTGFAPRTPLAIGIPHFASWFLEWSKQEK
jgi:UDP-glucuronate 4-epimerase